MAQKAAPAGNGQRGRHFELGLRLFVIQQRTTVFPVVFFLKNDLILIKFFNFFEIIVLYSKIL